LKTLILTQVKQKNKRPAAQQSIQRSEQGIALFLKNAPIHRLTKFDKKLICSLVEVGVIITLSFYQRTVLLKSGPPTILSKLET